MYIREIIVGYVHQSVSRFFLFNGNKIALLCVSLHFIWINEIRNSFIVTFLFNTSLFILFVPYYFFFAFCCCSLHFNFCIQQSMVSLCILFFLHANKCSDIIETELSIEQNIYAATTLTISNKNLLTHIKNWRIDMYIHIKWNYSNNIWTPQSVSEPHWYRENREKNELTHVETKTNRKREKADRQK